MRVLCFPLAFALASCAATAPGASTGAAPAATVTAGTEGAGASHSSATSSSPQDVANAMNGFSPAARAAAHAACDRVCGRIEACSGRPDPTCRKDCKAQGASRDFATKYAACADQLSCDAIIASLAMSQGPLGQCYTTALGR